MKILGIIPARGGSKSIPRKNIKDLGGKPLIAWTIDAAKEAGVFDLPADLSAKAIATAEASAKAGRLILSTDDFEIAEAGKKYGVEVPFMRPKELAEDKTPTLPVLQHAVNWLRENESYEPDAVMLLQPTAPLRQARHIVEAVELFKKSGADSVVSVVEIPGHFSPYWAVVEGEDGHAKLFVGDAIRKRITRRQDFPQKTYAHNGAIYLFKTKLLFGSPEPSLYGDNVRLYPMEEKYSVNIDSPEDWELAERMIQTASF
ncbi:MAG: acylneuraminate cytidylyltransferase family protein [Candidatus Sungbacteria bacterium]|nr:acylneuraminate cytidylyltransferase family protein [Candidatus Sungbacteria bacterium]